MTRHALDPLLKPGSIALVGVSDREGSPGHTLAKMVLDSDYAGSVFLVNPRLAEILDQRCYSCLESLPQTAEHIVIALGNQHLESALQAAIEHGAQAVTIYSSGILEEDSEPALTQRLGAMASAAGIQVCGINGMGFYNVSLNLYAGIFPRPVSIIKGEISYIAQSGSAFTTLCHNGCRLGFNLCVSAGNELTTTVADYMDWCLEQPDTRVIGLFLETVRNPVAFVAALEKANQKNIPVVILKIGRSPLGAAMALTHTGAIAGNHAVFQALFKRHGVIEVDDFDEMASILMLLQSGRVAPEGSLAAAFESGGLRELVTDEAFALGVPFAELEDSTLAVLQQNLDPGLKPENPLDAWGSHDRFEERFEHCMNALMQDPNVAAGVFISNFRDDYYLSEGIYRAVEAVSRKTSKPIALATCYSDLANSALCRRAHANGIALIDGAQETLLAFRHLFAYHRFRRARVEIAGQSTLAAEMLIKWKRRIEGHASQTLGEAEALALMADFDLPVVRHQLVSSEAQLIAAATEISYPLVLKTAEDGISHKSDSQGVCVGIESPASLRDHYADLCQRLGPRVLVCEMVSGEIEIGLGTVNDPQFGPVIMVAAGGVMIELLDDRAVAMCPVSAKQADDMLSSLKTNRLLAGERGKPPANRQALIDAIVSLSSIAFELRGHIAEIDINPVLVNEKAAVAVDALVIRQPTLQPC